MNLVRHQNIIHLKEVMATKTKIYFVMEYAKGGELFKRVSKGRLKENVARKYFQQLISAVNFCHSRGVYHRDLKPENLLLDENGNLKVSDFGLSALLESKRQDGLLHTTCGTPAYVAPDVISRKGYDGAKTDIWSCGVILYVLLVGHLPFHDRNVMELYKKITKSDYRCPHWFPAEARKLLSTILDPNPSTRVSIARIMEDPWFRKGLNSKLESGVEEHMELARPDHNLNAFEIISSLSLGLDLSGLFVSRDEKEEVQFTSMNSVSCIVSKLEDVAHRLRFRMNKKDQGWFRLEGEMMCIEIEIFQVSTDFHLVEFKRCSGDLVEYKRLLRQIIRPTLNEVIWSWQGEQQHH